MKKDVKNINKTSSFQFDNLKSQNDRDKPSYFRSCLFPFLPKFSSRSKDIIPRPSTTLLDLDLDCIVKPQNSF